MSTDGQTKPKKKGKIINKGSLLAPGRIDVWKTTLYHEDTHTETCKLKTLPADTDMVGEHV